MTAVQHFLEHQFVRYRATWSSTLVTSVLFPVFFLLAVGFGLGSQIDDTSTLGTTDYASYVGPGVLAAVAMLQAGGLSLWPTLAAIKWEGDYQASLSTPLSTRGLVFGHIVWIGFRITVSATIYLLVLLVFGVIGSWLAALAPLAAFTTALAIAAPLSAWSGAQDADDSFGPINRLGLTPLFLFSGAFFPIDQLPDALAWAVRAFPAWHGVELTRGLVNGTLGALAGLGHTAYLLLWATAGGLLCVRSFTKRLAA
jgi:lipooligosaccharide transport system permease protein